MRVCVPGSAANVYWQMGALDALTGCDGGPPLARVRGASAGAIAAGLAICGVRSSAAIARAYEISDLYGVDLNPFGVVGTWGGMIREWLDDVLPADCARRCSGRLEVVLRSVASRRLVAVSRFADKADLVSALLASCHLPFVLDLRPFAAFRGRWYVDGQLGVPDARISSGFDLVVTYRADPAYLALTRALGRVSYRSRELALRAARLGHRWMNARMSREKKGDLPPLSSGPGPSYSPGRASSGR